MHELSSNFEKGLARAHKTVDALGLTEKQMEGVLAVLMDIAALAVDEATIRINEIIRQTKERQDGS